ncbi:MAG: hypothetical protein ACLFVG_04730 [Candidatus Aminicenantes bacterium]
MLRNTSTVETRSVALPGFDAQIAGKSFNILCQRTFLAFSRGG